MKSPKISVLIPVYNGARHLAECLDTVLAQDFHDLEILLSDDRSQDDSVAIIRDYAARDARIRWWENRQNRGLTGNTNECLRAARGEYLKFVHQDDLLLSPTAISRLAAALDANPGVSLAACRQHLTGAGTRPLMFSQQGGVFDGHRVIVASLEQNTNLIGQPTLTLFRRQQAGRGFDERFTGFMDFEMWCHLLEQGDYAYVPEPLASWRVHEGQQTARDSVSREPSGEHLRFMEIYYAKPWLRQAATGRMLFAQIHYLEKRYGQGARHLTNVMRAQLGPGQFAWQWLKHMSTGPARKLARKVAGLGRRARAINAGQARTRVL
jgi:glycosyltransferase involved in cell wall biosynthesis